MQDPPVLDREEGVMAEDSSMREDNEETEIGGLETDIEVYKESQG